MDRTYLTPFDCYEEIGSQLTSAVPEPWKSITIELEIEAIDEIAEYCIYYTPKGWFRREGQFFIDDPSLVECFYRLARLTSKPEIGYFTKCKFVLSEDGAYRVEFTYPE
ncbi:MAG: hypothetical protein K0M64_02300 [Rhizobium sp.]|nr:hypothetical protein [Rhizobium sp.]